MRALAVARPRLLRLSFKRSMYQGADAVGDIRRDDLPRDGQRDESCATFLYSRSKSVWGQPRALTSLTSGWLRDGGCGFREACPRGVQ